MTDYLKILDLFQNMDDEWCANYRSIEYSLNIPRKVAKPIIAKLRKEGFIIFARGLMGEDGVAGSGWYFDYTKHGEATDLIQKAREAEL